MELLLLAGCAIEAPSSDAVGMYPIHWACTEGHLGALKWVSTPHFISLARLSFGIGVLR
jgi:hypothetical protein